MWSRAWLRLLSGVVQLFLKLDEILTSPLKQQSTLQITPLG